jgi:hypothetical protein
MAVPADAGLSAAPEKTQQNIIDRQSRATGKREIKKLFGPAETATNGFVPGLRIARFSEEIEERS